MLTQLRSLSFLPSLVLPIITAVLLSSVTGCGPKTVNTTPGGKVAYEAGRVLEAVKEVQKLVADLEAQHIIPTPAAGQVMIGAYKAGEAGEKLADLAQAYDLATGAGNAGEVATLAPRIEALLTTITTSFPQLDLPDGRAKQIAALVQAVITAVGKVRALIPELRNTVRPPQASRALVPAFA